LSIYGLIISMQDVYAFVLKISLFSDIWIFYSTINDFTPDFSFLLNLLQYLYNGTVSKPH
jgi:hypothetical protein